MVHALFVIINLHPWHEACLNHVALETYLKPETI